LFIDRDDSRDLVERGRPQLKEAISVAPVNSRFAVESIARLGSDSLNQGLVIAQLFATRIENIYLARAPRESWLDIVADAQRRLFEIRDKASAEAKQIRQSLDDVVSEREQLIVKLENARRHAEQLKQSALSSKDPKCSLVTKLREAISESELSVYAIANAAEVPQPVLSRFVSGSRGINLSTAEKVCRVLGLRLL
jgi:Cro/C1-type helix-turn-helix DNA-binding protein